MNAIIIRTQEKWRWRAYNKTLLEWRAAFLKRLAAKPYSTVRCFINARMSIALVRASTRCIRGSRIPCESQSRHFIPCVSSTDGMYEAQEFLKRLAKLLAEEWDKPYPTARDFLSARISIALVRATNRCIRGSDFVGRGCRTGTSEEWLVVSDFKSQASFEDPSRDSITTAWAEWLTQAPNLVNVKIQLNVARWK